MKKPFKLGLVICTYNRPEYLERCLESVKNAQIPNDSVIVIVDDCSTNEETKNLISDFEVKNAEVFKLKNEKNSSVSQSLLYGFNFVFAKGCKFATNIDSDALIREDFFSVILEYCERFPDRIVTGFNCHTRNANGSVRHHVISDHGDYNEKKSVGGINFAISQLTFHEIVRPVLEKRIQTGVGNWDHLACIESEKQGKSIICISPSVVQHIGFESSMNHIEESDTATDFKRKRLKGVQLIIVDCVNIDRALTAVHKSCEEIEFDKVTVLTSINRTQIQFDSVKNKHKEFVLIPPIKSKDQYSTFMVRELHKFITSEHVLVIQYDGYILNPDAWTEEFKQYDYIGAKWWFNDGMNVGNGGFSLRSKKLQFIIANDRNIQKFHPEDEIICRTYRPHLEKYGLKYAPESVANKFSIEGYKQSDKVYKGQFGFHGTAVRFEKETDSKDVIVMNQFFGLGDIIFSYQIALDYIEKGHKVLWAVEPHYVNINKHFPEVTFVDKSLLNINYNLEEEFQGNGFKVIPLRFSHRIMNVPFADCMKTKFTLFGKDWNDWNKTQNFRRDQKAEELLFKKLGLKDGDNYVLVNRTFRSNNTGKAQINPQLPKDVKVVEMKEMDGFTLFDWCKVIENASEIYTVSTSIIYILELIDIKAKNVYIYKRIPDERNHDNYSYILKKHNYKLM